MGAASGLGMNTHSRWEKTVFYIEFDDEREARELLAYLIWGRGWGKGGPVFRRAMSLRLEGVVNPLQALRRMVAEGIVSQDEAGPLAPGYL